MTTGTLTAQPAFQTKKPLDRSQLFRPIRSCHLVGGLGFAIPAGKEVVPVFLDLSLIVPADEDDALGLLPGPSRVVVQGLVRLEKCDLVKQFRSGRAGADPGRSLEQRVRVGDCDADDFVDRRRQ